MPNREPIREREMSNPKELFLNSLNTAMRIFEDETGCEIHNINMERISKRECVDICDKTIIVEYKLGIK